MSYKGKLTTEKDIFGNSYHYDEYGRKVGESRKSPFGMTEHFDEYGRKTGSSFTNAFGESTHYDSNGHKMGTSQSSILGTDHYDNSGRKIGRTDNIGVATVQSSFDDNENFATGGQDSPTNAGTRSSEDSRDTLQPACEGRGSFVNLLLNVITGVAAFIFFFNFCTIFVGYVHWPSFFISGALLILMIRRFKKKSKGRRKV